jgi:hypothetical protein
MVYRGLGFLAVVWLGSLPTPWTHSHRQVVSLSHCSCVSPVEIPAGKGGRNGRGRSQIIWPQESLALCKSFSIRCKLPFISYKKNRRGAQHRKDRRCTSYSWGGWLRSLIVQFYNYTPSPKALSPASFHQQTHTHTESYTDSLVALSWLYFIEDH